MEYFARSDELRVRLRQNISEKWTVVHHFFFDFGADKDMLNNFEGFLRSLLYQLVDESSGIAEEVIPGKVDSPGIESRNRWSIRQLHEKLMCILEQRSNPICILLDGLDEYRGNKWDLAKILTEMAGSRVKLCLASRPDRVLNVAFKDYPTLKMQDFNTPAIDRMVTLKIRDSMAGSGFYEHREVVQLAEEISTKANGVFLWARFAIEELRDGWSAGLEMVELQRRLENVPKELEDIYARIISKFEPGQKQKAAHMLQLVCYAKRTLTLSELYVATAHAAGRQDLLVKQLNAYDKQQFEKTILVTTGGVLEVFRSRAKIEDQDIEDDSVSVIHRTVRTYLESSGWIQILGAEHKDMLHAQVLWLRVCAGVFPPSFRSVPPFDRPEGSWRHTLMLRRVGPSLDPPSSYFADAQLPSTRSLSLDRCSDMSDRISPLLQYAAAFMLHHAIEVEQGLGLPSYEMLQPGMSNAFMCYHRFYEAARDEVCACFQWCPEPLHPLHLAVAHGLDGYVKDFLSMFCEKTVQGSREWNDVFDLEVPHKQKHHYPFLRWNSLERNIDQLQMSLLEFAIHHASKHHFNGPSQARIVALLLNQIPGTHDAEMVFALQNSPAEVVQLMLPHWPDGKIRFKPETLAADEDLTKEVSRSGLSNFLLEPSSVGPLWYIARRHTSFEEDDARLVDLFVRRGEDINGQCGPVGTALHAALFRLAFLWPKPDMWKVLIANGADINAQGPLGTPLELVWRLANTVERRKYKYVRPIILAIQWLLQCGAVNDKCDPNGSVPSKERMLAFGRPDMESYRESLRTYRGETNNDETGEDGQETPGEDSSLVC